jgi:4-amino-4-deoxy-L-arabinose transferase-like glycosyltransferase
VRVGFRQHTGRYLVIVLLLAVVVRLAVALYLGDEVDAPPLLTDQRSYHALGARLIEGHGFSFADNWYPFTRAGAPTSHWSFLYSLLVAGVYAAAGPHPLAVRLVQAVLGGLLLPWMVYRLARTVFSPRETDPVTASVSEAVPTRGVGDRFIALVAALIAAVYGYFILYAATLMTETLFIVVLLWSLERALALARRLRAGKPGSLWSLGVTLGLSLGLATLVRQSILPWLPVLFLYLLWLGWRNGQLRRAFSSLVLAGLMVVAFVLPWTVRNYLVYDEFLLLNSNAGYAMYSAQHPMHGTRFSEFEAAPLPEGIWGRPEPEMDRALMRQGIQFVLDEPGRYLLLSLSRVRAFFEFWPTPDTTLLHNVGRVGSFGLFLPFMVYGLVLALRRPGFLGQNAVLFLFAAFYTVLHVLTWAMVRYRLPVDAVMIPFAGLAIVDLWARVRVRLSLSTA